MNDKVYRYVVTHSGSVVGKLLTFDKQLGMYLDIDMALGKDDVFGTREEAQAAADKRKGIDRW